MMKLKCQLCEVIHSCVLLVIQDVWVTGFCDCFLPPLHPLHAKLAQLSSVKLCYQRTSASEVKTFVLFAKHVEGKVLGHFERQYNDRSAPVGDGWNLVDCFSFVLYQNVRFVNNCISIHLPFLKEMFIFFFPHQKSIKINLLRVF